MRRNEFDLLWVLYRPVAFGLTSLGKYAKILSTTYQRLIKDLFAKKMKILSLLQNKYINKDSIRLVLSLRCKTRRLVGSLFIP